MALLLRTPRVIRVGTDFSGLDTAIIALKRLGLPLQHAFSSDCDAGCKKMLRHFHSPQFLFNDAATRSPEEEVAVDCYVATPPCQPWSSQGKRLGLRDPRGQLLKVPVQYAKRQRPRLFVLENVKGLCSKTNRPVLRGIKAALEKLDYKVFLGVLNAADYQVPQQRARLFVVAIRKDSYRRPFKWPKKKGKRSLSDVLDAPGPTDMAGRLPKNARAKALTVDAFKKVHKRGIDPRRVPVAIDIGCTKAYSTFGVDVSRTLCQSRAKTGGFWISTRGRKMSTNEILKVSGFKSDELQGWQEHVSKAQLQGMLGNCVPVPLVGCVLQGALYAAGLISRAAEFPI